MDSAALLTLARESAGGIRCEFTTRGSRNWRYGAAAESQLGLVFSFRFNKFDDFLETDSLITRELRKTISHIAISPSIPPTRSRKKQGEWKVSMKTAEIKSRNTANPDQEVNKIADSRNREPNASLHQTAVRIRPGGYSIVHSVAAVG